MKQGDGDLAWFFAGYLIREQERMKKGQEKKTKDDILWKAAQERAVVFNDKRSGRDGNWKEPVPTARSVRASPSPKTCRHGINRATQTGYTEICFPGKQMFVYHGTKYNLSIGYSVRLPSHSLSCYVCLCVLDIS